MLVCNPLVLCYQLFLLYFYHLSSASLQLCYQFHDIVETFLNK